MTGWTKLVTEGAEGLPDFYDGYSDHVVYHAGAFWFFRDGENILTTTDFVTWTDLGYGTYGNVNSSAMLSFGGYLYHICGVWAATGQVYRSVDGVEWTLVTDSPEWDSRYWDGTGQPAVVWGGKMWLVGGRDSGAPGNGLLSDVWYSSDGETWTQATADGGFTGRYGGTLFVHDGYLYFGMGVEIDGETEASLADLWRSSDGITWEQMTDGLPEEFGFYRYMWSQGSSIVLLCGLGADDSPGNSVWHTVGYRTTDGGVSWVAFSDLDFDDIDWAEEVVVLNDRTFALGPDQFLWEYVSASAPAELEWWRFACDPYGSLVGTDLTVAQDFTRTLVFDLDLNAVFPGFGFPIVSTLGRSSPCAGPADLPAGIFGGCSDGYVAKVFSEDAYGLGTPTRKVAWTLSTCTTTQLVIPSDGGDFWPADGLIGLPVVVLYADGTEVSGVVSDNDNLTLTLATALTTAPSAGDVVLISPMTCGVMFAERRFGWPARLGAIEANIYINQAREQQFTVEVFQADQAEGEVDLSAPVVARDFTTGDLKRAGSRVMFPPNGSRALSYGLNFRPNGGGYFHIEALKAEEWVHEREAGK